MYVVSAANLNPEIETSSSFILQFTCNGRDLYMTEVDTTSVDRASSNDVLGNFSIEDEIEVTIMVRNNHITSYLDKVRIPVLCLDRNKPSPLTMIDDGVEIDILFNIIDDSHITDELLFQSFDSKLNLTLPPADLVYDGPLFTDDMDAPISLLAENAVKESSLPTVHLPKRRVWRLSTTQLYNGLKQRFESLSTSDSIVSLSEFLHSLTDFISAASKFVFMVIVDLNVEFIKSLDSILTECLQQLDNVLNKFIEDGIERLFIALHSFLQALWKQYRLFYRIQHGAIVNVAKTIVHQAVSTTNPLLHIIARRAEPLLEVGQPLAKPIQQRAEHINNYLESSYFCGSLYRGLKQIGTVVIDEAIKTYHNHDGESP